MVALGKPCHQSRDGETRARPEKITFRAVAQQTGQPLVAALRRSLKGMFVNVLRLIRFEHCLVLLVAAEREPDRLILAPEAVVTTAAVQSCADRESLKCQKSHDAEEQHRPWRKATTFPLPEQQQPLH